MLFRRLIITLLALFTLFGLQTQSQIQEKLQFVLDSLCLEAGYPGSVMTIILPKGEEIRMAYGMADMEKQIPMPLDGRMFSGSTGKTFVSAIVMQLIDEGKLDVDRYAKSYFQGEAWFDSLPNSGTMKIRHLLNHTSGLPRYVFKPEYWETFNKDRMRHYPPEELLAFVAGDDPVHDPGEGWGYSDTGYLIIGLIIEKTTGKPYYDVLVDRILEPFKLSLTTPSTSRTFKGLVQGYTGDHVPPYNLPPKVIEDGKYIFNPDFEYTGGGVVTSSVDLARWTKMLYEGKIFSGARLEELLSPMDFRTGKPAESGYGFGVFVYQTPHGAAWGHGGFFFGYQTEMLYLPDIKCSIAFQVNTDQTSGMIKMPPLNIVMLIAEELRKTEF